jgi:hypothetical protein
VRRRWRRTPRQRRIPARLRPNLLRRRAAPTSCCAPLLLKRNSTERDEIGDQMRSDGPVQWRVEDLAGRMMRGEAAAAPRRRAPPPWSSMRRPILPTKSGLAASEVRKEREESLRLSQPSSTRNQVRFSQIPHPILSRLVQSEKNSAL